MYDIIMAANLVTIFKRFDKYNLRLNPIKCAFGLEEILLLGYKIIKDGIKADPEKASAISDLDHPKDIQEVR